MKGLPVVCVGLIFQFSCYTDHCALATTNKETRQISRKRVASPVVIQWFDRYIKGYWPRLSPEWRLKRLQGQTSDPQDMNSVALSELKVLQVDGDLPPSRFPSTTGLTALQIYRGEGTLTNFAPFIEDQGSLRRLVLLSCNSVLGLRSTSLTSLVIRSSIRNVDLPNLRSLTYRGYLDLSDFRFPTLEHLSVTSIFRSRRRNGTKQEWPRLRSLQIIDFFDGDTRLLANVTKLMVPVHLHHKIANAVKLEELTLLFSETNPPLEPIALEILRLPHLRRLELQRYGFGGGFGDYSYTRSSCEDFREALDLAGFVPGRLTCKVLLSFRASDDIVDLDISPETS